MTNICSKEEIARVTKAEHRDPFSVLGMHTENGEIVIRAFYPNARKIHIINLDGNERYEMEKHDEVGFFSNHIKKTKKFKYKFEILDFEGNKFERYDHYSFMPSISEYDLYLFNEGNHHKVYEKLGAHTIEHEGVKGTLFSVWAPCAKRISVVGKFNNWDGRTHQMRMRGATGVWELFIPEIGHGEMYKFEIKTPNGEIYVKSDPYTFYSQVRPETASIVYNLDNYSWSDMEWIKKRDNNNTFENPISIYELHLGSWKRISQDEDGVYNYREIAEKLIPYIKEMGYTHIELMPVSEHPFDGSWGYQLTGYYAATSRYGEPEDLMYFIDQCHQNDIGVLVDWVPAHFPKDGHGLARFDGTALYEHYHTNQGEHPDWGTHIFNYGRHEVKNFLISNAIFWFEKYHIDGLRVDAVASMLYLDYAKEDGQWICNKWGGKENIEAIDFLRQLNSSVYKYYPGAMMIAEESTSWSLVTKPPYVGGLGFTYKWNMGWMNDFIRYISMDPIYRKYHHNLLTFSMVYAYAENFILVLSHDEVVHGKCSMLSKMPGDYWQKFAGLRASYGFMYAHPGKKLLFMGGEFGQFIEWDFKKELDWNLLEYDMHEKMQNYVKDLNNLYKTNKCLYEIDFDPAGFEWIDDSDQENSIITFVRKAKDWKDSLMIICNFTPCTHESYRVGDPFKTSYEEVFNSDSEKYGGSDVRNIGIITTKEFPYHGKQNSIELRIPPLSVIMLKPKF